MARVVAAIDMVTSGWWSMESASIRPRGGRWVGWGVGISKHTPHSSSACLKWTTCAQTCLGRVVFKDGRRRWLLVTHDWWQLRLPGSSFVYYLFLFWGASCSSGTLLILPRRPTPRARRVTFDGGSSVARQTANGTDGVKHALLLVEVDEQHSTDDDANNYDCRLYRVETLVDSRKGYFFAGVLFFIDNGDHASPYNNTFH